MSLLDDDLVSIPVYYTYADNKYGSKRLAILDDEKATKMMENEKEKSTLQVLNTQWKNLSWSEQNTMMKVCEKPNAPGELPSFDWSLFQDQRVKNCLKSWDMKTDDGKPIPVSSDNIDRLPNTIVRDLLDKFDAVTQIGDEETGKSSTQ